MKNATATRERTYTQKELQVRWAYDLHAGLFPSIKTVRRDIRRYGLRPARFIGLQPVFFESAVVAMERRRDLAKRQITGFLDERDGGSAIISVATAKKRARNGVRK